MKIRTIVHILLILLILVTTSLIPSGNITPEAKMSYINTDTDEEGFSFKLLSNAYAEGNFGSSVAIPIPLEDKKGRPAKSENFTENSYEDSTIKVTISDGRYLDANYHIAYVEISDPSQLRTALASKPGSSRTVRMSDLAPKLNAVVAMNGDFFTQFKDGFIMRQGDVLRKQTSKNHDLLLIDSNGDFHMIKRGGAEQIDEINSIIKQYEIINTFSFGPILVQNGNVQVIPEKYPHASKYRNPRAAIAQIDKLHYAILVVDGRTDESEGLTIEELADLCGELNLNNAFNLDGGNSAVLYFNDGLYTQKSKENERYISDVIYFTTAEMN